MRVPDEQQFRSHGLRDLSREWRETTEWSGRGSLQKV
jgi:hypothetical protein